MEPNQLKNLTEYLSDFISEERLNRINEVLNFRTNHLAIVLEDLHKSHNANAVLRSCDGFGVQDVHIIENNNEFDAATTVTLGAHQWLSLHRYNQPENDNIDICFNELRKRGYQIIVTTPHERDSDVGELDVSKKTALVFGTELEGVSDAVMERADGFVKIPMFGFSESFNISVSAAVFMYELTNRIRRPAHAINWKLPDDYQAELRLRWIKQSIKAGDHLVERFLNRAGLSA